MQVIKTNNQIASFLIRFGLAGVLAYAAIAALKTPSDWIVYLPHILTKHIDSNFLIKIFAVYELLLAIWIISGKYVQIAGIIATATFSGIFISNLDVLSITFRDFALILASASLIFIKS